MKMLQNRIPKELEVGKTYTSEEILGFIMDNDVKVLCDSDPVIRENDGVKFKVKQFYQTYLHRSQPRWTY